ncbi:hypothetical protein Efla_001467 [Eimeria flavescens]
MRLCRATFGGPLLQLRRRPCRVGGALYLYRLSLALPLILAVAVSADADAGGSAAVGDGAETADIATKVVAAALVFLCALLGAIPAFVVLRRQQQQQTEGLLRHRSNSCPVPPACCSSNYGAAASACCLGVSPFYVRAATVFTAGVVAAVALLHLLPAADRRLTKAINLLTEEGAPLWGPQYPAAALCCLVGLLLSAALEAVVEQQVQQRQQQQQEDENADGCVSSLSADSINKEDAPLGAGSFPLLHSEKNSVAAAAAAAAGEAPADSRFGAELLPARGEEAAGSPPARGGHEARRCLIDFGGPGRGGDTLFDLEVSSAPPGDLRRHPVSHARPGLHYSFRCCAGSSCCSSHHSSHPQKGTWQVESSPAAAADAAASGSRLSCSSSNNGQGDQQTAPSCPYSLLEDTALGSAPTQQRKGPRRGGPLFAGQASSAFQGGGSSGLVGSLLLTGLSVHSLLEGFTLGMAPNPKTVAVAILFHKTLEAFAVGSSLLHVQAALGSYVVQMLFYALTAPLGVAAGICLQLSVSSQATNSGGAPSFAVYLQLIPGLLIGLGAGAFLHVALLEILASEMQRCRREKRGDMLRLIGLTAVGALCMAFV